MGFFSINCSTGFVFVKICDFQYIEKKEEINFNCCDGNGLSLEMALRGTVLGVILYSWVDHQRHLSIRSAGKFHRRWIDRGMQYSRSLSVSGRRTRVSMRSWRRCARLTLESGRVISGNKVGHIGTGGRRCSRGFFAVSV